MPARRPAVGRMEPHLFASRSSSGARRPVMEEFVYPLRRFGTDALDLHQVGDRGALDRLERAEVVQQGALARRPDAGDFLPARLAYIARTPRRVRADGETMGLIAQPLDEVEHRIARRQLERVAAREEEGFAAGVAVRALGDGDQRHLGAEAGP